MGLMTVFMKSGLVPGNKVGMSGVRVGFELSQP